MSPRVAVAKPPTAASPDQRQDSAPARIDGEPSGAPLLHRSFSGLCIQPKLTTDLQPITAASTGLIDKLPVSPTRQAPLLAFRIRFTNNQIDASLNASFPGVPIATLLSRLQSLIAQLLIMGTPAGQPCRNTCLGPCSRPAFMAGQGPTALMTLCTEFIHSMTLDDRVETLMHEGMRATSGPPVVDTAYRSQRLAGAGTVAGGPPADTVAGMSGTEEDAARHALAFLEKWVEVAEWDTSQLYDAVKRNIGRAGGWDPGDRYHAETQHVIGWLLSLTDPGAAPPFAATPTQTDQVKVAGIHDRYNRMNGAVDRQPISISKGPSEGWAPDLGASVVVAVPFFGLGAGDQVLYLLRLMTTSMPDVPAPLRSNYANAADQIRWHKGGIGP
jgi:hypothetical protein